MPQNDELIIKPVELEDYDWIYPYTSTFGEGSCQHSPVSMVSLQEKYGDSVCEKDGFLYTLCSRLCDGTYRVYLAPLGEGDRAAAYARVLADARAHGRKAKFLTLTETAAAALEEAFPGRFELTEDRDLAEYIFTAETFAEFPGKFHERRRREIRSFWRLYGDRVSVRQLDAAQLDELLCFAETWLRDNAETHEEAVLQREMLAIRRQMAHYAELRLSGTVIRLDGQIIGFCYGTPLNDTYYDVLIEKGDRQIPGIYRVIRQESTRLNLPGFQYVNFEEDLGVPGLRKVKESYGPAFMIRKYIATEKG